MYNSEIRNIASSLRDILSQPRIDVVVDEVSRLNDNVLNWLVESLGLTAKDDIPATDYARKFLTDFLNLNKNTTRITDREYIAKLRELLAIYVDALTQGIDWTEPLPNAKLKELGFKLWSEDCPNYWLIPVLMLNKLPDQTLTYPMSLTGDAKQPRDFKGRPIIPTRAFELKNEKSLESRMGCYSYGILSAEAGDDIGKELNVENYAVKQK